MNHKEQPKPIPDPYTEISRPDEEGRFEIDSAGKKEPKVIPSELRVDREQEILKKLRNKDPERYQKVWEKARENAGTRMEQEGMGLSAQEHGEKFNQIQQEEAERLAQKELEDLEKIER